MAELKALTRKRAAVKARLTTFSTYLQQFTVIQDDEVGSILEKDIIQIEQRTQAAEQLLPEFESIQTQIEALSDDDKLEEQFQQTAVFENAYFSAIAQAKAIIATRNETIQSNDDNSSVASGSRRTAQSARADNSTLTGIKLPTIQLPKFDGNYETWLEYRDTYESLIHSNESISSIQKYHYLRASLEGSSASQVIKSLEFTGENYAIAWNTLCERYNNTRLLISNHVKALFNIEPVVKESAYKLRKLIDEISKHLRALEQLKQPIDKWDTLVIYLISTKLDTSTARRWEEYKSDKNIPNLQDFKTFLKARADLLETLEQRNAPKGNLKHSGGGSTTTRGLFSGQMKCVVCNKGHLIYNCEDFSNLCINERIEKAQNLKLCLNCLKPGHFAKNCRLSACRKCKAKHNTLLHIQSSRGSDSEQQNSDKVTSQPDEKITALSSYYSTEQVLLSTALVQVFDRSKKAHTVRVLLDSASMSSFICSRLCDKLNLTKIDVNVMVSGLNNACSQTTQKCDIMIQSLYNDFCTAVTCFTLPKITDNLPDTKVNVADPGFYKPGNIDLLIGADLFWSLICVGQVSLGPSKPILQKTKFGWVVSGQVRDQNTKQISCNFSSTRSLNDQLALFWEIEECSSKQPFSNEENAVEEHFINTTKRNAEGRFIVAIPFKEPLTKLGESREIARRRFYALERNLNTVTYGQAASSYLAIRCLVQLAYECESRLPDISQIIRHDFYVDDLLSGANSIEEAVYICKNVDDILRSGCFELRQWASNEPTIISSFDESNCDNKVFEFGIEKETKTLGLKWSSKADNLMYNVDRNLGNSKITKRSILSQISRIFDPLGLLSPCIIIAKSLLQKLWSTKLTWDESLPNEAHTIWLKFSAELLCLNDLKIPRHAICKEAKYLELHIFSDASSMAYGSCENWPTLSSVECESLPETKQSVQAYVTATDDMFPFERFSDLCKLKRTTAYIIRFKNNALKANGERYFGPLLFDEIAYAFYNLIRVMQSVSFPEDYIRLSHAPNELAVRISEASIAVLIVLSLIAPQDE
ncbi:hypothetical protein NQ317_005322 [Molorchus minor]|uniref:CCHC-type domain-containing protein n=1 Tax=Molorchus minor TaxID=1323400 RepID=A0ABQ9JYR4_9CUCU|nr:hypothetical protein NQ317_005322 [Molorchus minor]